MNPIVSKEVSALMIAAGYVAEGTGGGCMAWAKTPAGDAKTVLYISNENELDGDPHAAEWMVGRYSAVDCGSVDYCDEVTLLDALAIADRLPSPIMADGSEIQDTIGTHGLLPDVGEMVGQMKKDILADVKRGHVPATVQSFADLHNHVDANEYYGVTMHGDESRIEALCVICNAAAERIDAWIKTGALKVSA